MFSFVLESNCQVDSGYVDIKNGVLFYRIWGAGEPVVFLNGGPGFASNGYEVYAEEVSKNRKVILFDQRGTGKSKLKEGLETVSLHEMIDDLEKLREHLKIKKWNVYGHSFGGEYALGYIVKHPDKINKVILSAAPGVGVNIFKKSQAFRNPKVENLTDVELEVYNLHQIELSKENPSKERERRLSMALKARYYVSKPENYPIVIDWFLNKCRPGALYLENMEVGPKRFMIRKLKKFKNPVLIIHGINDFLNFLNPKSNHDALPNSQLEIIYDSGHMMSIDSKEAYFEKVNKFLD